jgi:hypothetical protein
VLGGLFASENGFTLYNDVQFSSLANDGLIPQGAWQKASAFQIPRSGLGVVHHNGFLYIVGGFAQQGTLDDIQFAPLRSDGSIGPWAISPYRLKIPRSNHRLEVFATPSGAFYLAAIAGVGDVGKDTVHFDEIEVAPINSDGSIGQWRECPFHLKGGRSAPGTAIVNGQIYVIGGWGDRLIEDVFSDVQYAAIRDDGCTDPWVTSRSPLNMPLYGHTAVVVSGASPPLILVLGGNAGEGNYFNNVQFSGLTAASDIGRWTFDRRQFAIPRWGHATVAYQGFIYIIGGAQRGANGYLNDVQVIRY